MVMHTAKQHITLIAVVGILAGAVAEGIRALCILNVGILFFIAPAPSSSPREGLTSWLLSIVNLMLFMLAFIVPASITGAVGGVLVGKVFLSSRYRLLVTMGIAAFSAVAGGVIADWGYSTWNNSAGEVALFLARAGATIIGVTIAVLLVTMLSILARMNHRRQSV